jgi:hypothetical protein
MSENIGNCNHIVNSNGYCPECKKIVSISFVDCKSKSEQEYDDSINDNYIPLFSDSRE